jgi:hypothetical protein
MGEINIPIQKYCIYKYNPDEELTILYSKEDGFLHTINTPRELFPSKIALTVDLTNTHDQ